MMLRASTQMMLCLAAQMKKSIAIAMDFLEATSRFELENNGFADRGLTTWLCRRFVNVGIISRQGEFVKGFSKIVFDN